MDTIEFRNALGKFATGVTVVTAKNPEGGFVGTTASSFNSVSLDPALILWSIDNSARSLLAYETGEHFVVNILAADQVSISNHFARQQDDKFQDVDYELNAEGVPLLPSCAANFECKLYATYEGGDHTIIVGEVIRFSTASRKALLFHQGAYAVSEFHPAAENRVEKPVEEQGLPFAESYLPCLMSRGFHQLMKNMKQILKLQNMSEIEYRLLASLLDVESRSRDELQKFAVLADEEFTAELERLCDKGLIQVEGSRVALTEEGKGRVEPIMFLAKSNEADALGSFNVEEALLFKRYLRKMLEGNG
jgi:flavin reductase (DIM6/NTAB) family NADH-FMN oxidoreductase RutF/DNA-binding MarR family transcriptional regulator